MNLISTNPVPFEAGVESAKTFLGKLLNPAIEEAGLLIKDPVMMWKFKNEVKMLNKAKAICEKNKINPKAISLKLLVPLLSNAALEEDEVLQDKWAILLSNLVDSEQNIENHVFPYILSQLSSNEFSVLELAFEEKHIKVQSLIYGLERFLKERPQKESEIFKKIDEINIKISQLNEDILTNNYFSLDEERKELKREIIRNSHYEEHNLNSRKTPVQIPFNALKDFEESNLIRLGLIKEVKEFYANSQTLKIPIDPESSDYETGLVSLDLDVDVDSKTEVILTQLGELFMIACKEKNGKHNVNERYMPF